MIKLKTKQTLSAPQILLLNVNKTAAKINNLNTLNTMPPNSI